MSLKEKHADLALIKGINPNWKEIIMAMPPKEELEWKYQSKMKDKPFATYVTYITARSGIRMLNEVFGLCWSDTYREGTMDHIVDFPPKDIKLDGFKTAIGAKALVPISSMPYTTCIITVRDPETGEVLCSREDRATSADIDPEKSSVSNAFKRAITKFGYATQLYDMPKVQVQLNDANFPCVKSSVLRKNFDLVYEIFMSGEYEDVYAINDKGVLCHFEYGKPGAEVKFTKTSASKPKEEPKKEEPPVKQPELFDFPSDIMSDEASKLLVEWNGAIIQAKDESFHYIIVNKKVYKLDSTNYQYLLAHQKHEAWRTKQK